MHFFWCSVLFAGLTLMRHPLHSPEAPRPVASHRAELAAVAKLMLTVREGVHRSTSETENRKCCPRSGIGETVIATTGVDPIDVSPFVPLPARTELPPGDPPVAPLQPSPGRYRPGVVRSRSPPA